MVKVRVQTLCDDETKAMVWFWRFGIGESWTKLQLCVCSAMQGTGLASRKSTGMFALQVKLTSCWEY